MIDRDHIIQYSPCSLGSVLVEISAHKILDLGKSLGPRGFTSQCILLSAVYGYSIVNDMQHCAI